MKASSQSWARPPLLWGRGVLAALAAGLAVVGVLTSGGEPFRLGLAFTGALVTAALLEEVVSSPMRRWALALPVGWALYALLG